jgi:tetratricopeptide (TPR) repeat protein
MRDVNATKVWGLLGVLGLISACATTSGSGAGVGAADRRVEMDKVVVRAGEDPLTGLDGYDAVQLLRLGNEQYEAGEFDIAVKIYERLIAEFPESELVAQAHYNRGLAYEQLVEWERAATAFERVVEDFPESDSRKPAYFRLAFAYSKLERWVELADTFWAVRQLDLKPLEELEARVGTGVGFFMQEDYATAEREFLHALGFFDDHADKQFLPADYFIGQSRFYLGEIYARWFEEKRLSTPPAGAEDWTEAMGEELEEKCRLLLRAQNNFIRAIRVGHTGWATAAGYRIGSLYEILYDELTDLPVPPDLDGEARAIYVEEVRKKVSVLVVKAIKVYEMSLEMAERVGESNEWVERTNRSLERMKTLYRSEMLDT